MKKLHSVILWVSGFMASYVIDLAYIPLYAVCSGFLVFLYAMVSELIDRPNIMPLWKLFLITFAVVFALVGTVLNALSIVKVHKRFKQLKEMAGNTKK